MKIYTKTGDHGQTRIIGKKIVTKDDIRVAAYGTIDELNSWIGLTIADLNEATAPLADELTEIQQLLFDAGSDLARMADDTRHPFIFEHEGKATGWLETLIDRYTEAVPPVQKFILPGGTKTAANLHMARTITRRAEREIVALQNEAEINPDVLIFVNRLSDYFFAAARYANLLEKKEDILYRNSKPVFK